MAVKRKYPALLLCLCLACLFAFGSAAYAEEPYEGNPEDSTIVEDLDLEGWQKYEKLDTISIWYGAVPLPGNVIAFYEDWHEQCGICFLILGTEKALLWDTGIGIGNIREEVEQYTDLPIIVLNSHDHFDHIGGNALFDEVWCYDLPSAVRHLTNGPTETELNEIRDRNKSLEVLMKKYGIEIPERVPGKAPTGTVQDGQIIDLGGRKLEVIHTPGHQASCIMLLDRENKLLFTGDMFYLGPLYCLYDDSSFPDYVKSIRKAADLAAEVGIKEVYPSHNLPTTDVEYLFCLADYLEGIEKGEITEYFTELGFRIYEMDETIKFIMLDDGTEPLTGYSMIE